MRIKILYEDKDILAIEKPSGILVHPDTKTSPENKEKTIVDWVLKNYPKMEKVGDSGPAPTGAGPRPGIVHRLDKETSGVLLLAKNQKAFESLKKQFAEPSERIAKINIIDPETPHESKTTMLQETYTKKEFYNSSEGIKKTYIAIVSGHVKSEHGIINKKIGRSSQDFRKQLSGRGTRGTLREAVTEYKVLKRFTTGKEKVPFTILEVSPRTGRRHQIRVHMKFFSHPIACDTLYNPKGICPLKNSRLALHAKSIEFKNLKGKTIKVESPIPPDFLKLEYKTI
jgi:23S rRNA pseudouridine1911/1915/1917 synthase